MKKGFTLIELLAVIIIIGVIGVITVPMVLKTVDDTKEKAFVTGAQSVLESAIAYVTRVEETGEIPLIGTILITGIGGSETGFGGTVGGSC